MRKIALAASFCLLPLSHAMAESWYEVEVFLFERNQPSAETWPKIPKIPPFAKGVDLIAERFQSSSETALTPCSDDERVVDPLRCEGVDMQRSSLANALPSPMPTRVTGKAPATAQSGSGAQLLDGSQLQLGDLVSHISRERGIKPLMHIGWQQSMGSRHGSRAVRILGGENFADRFQLNGDLKAASTQGPETERATNDTSASETNLAISGEVSAPSQPVWQLDGLIKVYLSQFLYVETDLVLRAPGTRKVEVDTIAPDQALLPTPSQPPQQANTTDTVASPSAANIVAFEEQPFLYAVPLNQNRRVRSGQVHYFDHPKLGLIIQVRKMAQPGGAVEVEESTAEPEGDDAPAVDVINTQQATQD